MRRSNTTPKSIFAMAAAAVLSIGLASSAARAAPNMKKDANSYEWSANLISFDKASSTAVLQARVESYITIDGLDQFKDGDKLTLVWTGREWAAGVRNLAEHPKMMPGMLSMPVEFVSTEHDGQYIDFRIHVPAGAVDTIAAMEPGTRVTGMSPKTAKDWMSAVTSLRGYNDVE